jgi:hypothetical protein
LSQCPWADFKRGVRGERGEWGFPSALSAFKLFGIGGWRLRSLFVRAQSREKGRTAISDFVVLLRAFFHKQPKHKTHLNHKDTEARRTPDSVFDQFSASLCLCGECLCLLRLRLRRAVFFAVKFRVDLISENLTC